MLYFVRDNRLSQYLSRCDWRDLGYESWYQNTGVPGLPNGANSIILRSLVLSQYRRMTHAAYG